MTSNRIVLAGFAGPIGSGKNAAAMHWGADVVVEHSDPIYEALAAMLGTTREWVREHKEKPIGWLPGRPTARKLLVTLGTEWGREMIAEDLWVTLAADKIKKCLALGYAVGVPGVRFANEVASIRRLGGAVLWIHRPGFEPAADHKSERSLSPSDCDWVVSNSGSLDSLGRNVRSALAAIAETRIAASE